MRTNKALEVMTRLESSTKVVTFYAESDCSKAITSMLDSLIEVYKIDLMHVHPEGLQRLQASIQQAQAIRDVVANETTSIPKI